MIAQERKIVKRKFKGQIYPLLVAHHSIKELDKAIYSFAIPTAIGQVFRNFFSSLDFIRAKASLRIMLQGWTGPRKVFSELLYQLTSNTIKFWASSRTLQLTIRIKQLPNGNLKITVADNGRGIDICRNRGRIYKLFYQEHPHAANNGIGLSIVKNLVNYFGGQISVNS